MTANQIAYQANKIKEREAAIKQQEADTKSRRTDMQNKLDLSSHIHEYGELNDERDQNILGGQKTWKDMSQVSKNIFDSATGMFKLFK